MLIAISGSQGAGKTVLVNELEKCGYYTIQRKTSRSILSDWGVTLSQVNNNRDLTVKFQDEILVRKMADESVAVHSSDVWVTERTFADLFTYACVAIGKDNEYSDWLDEYFHKCAAAQTMYDRVFYLKGGLFPVQNDGVRAVNQHYSRMVDLFMEEYTSKMSDSTIRRIDTPQLDERVNFVLTHTQDVYTQGVRE